jgi:hypothetical protein
VTYRDENEALRARLADAEAEIGRLKGMLQPAARGTVNHSALAGGPTSLEEIVVVDGELSRDDHDVVAEAMLGRGLVGQPTTLGRSLVVSLASQQSARMVQVTVTPKDGKTTIRVRESFAGLLGGLYGGLLGGLGGGGLGLVLPLTLLADPHNGLLALGAAAAWVAAVFGATRVTYGRVAAGRVKDANVLAQAIAESVREAIAARAGRPRVRVQAEGTEEPGEVSDARREARRPR